MSIPDYYRKLLKRNCRLIMQLLIPSFHFISNVKHPCSPCSYIFFCYDQFSDETVETNIDVYKQESMKLRLNCITGKVKAKEQVNSCKEGCRSRSSKVNLLVCPWRRKEISLQHFSQFHKLRTEDRLCPTCTFCLLIFNHMA